MAIVLLCAPSEVWIAVGNEYTAYFDDGGHPDDQPVVLVAGFVSTAEQWDLFSGTWRDFLRHYGVECLHMTDLMARQKEYRGWSDEKVRYFIEEAAMWVRLRARMSFCVLVPMEDYAEVNQGYAIEECLGAPYALAARYAMDKLSDWSDAFNKPKWPVRTILEDGTKHKGDLMAIFARDGFETPAFAKKKTAAPLQACDWLAWEAFSWFKAGTNERGISASSSYAKLLRIPYEHYVWTRSSLEDECASGVPLRSKMGAHTRISFWSDKRRLRRRTIYSLSATYPNYVEHIDEIYKRVQRLRQDHEATRGGTAQRSRGQIRFGEEDWKKAKG